VHLALQAPADAACGRELLLLLLPPSLLLLLLFLRTPLLWGPLLLLLPLLFCCRACGSNRVLLQVSFMLLPSWRRLS
jgi:hypothetical protein